MWGVVVGAVRSLILEAASWLGGSQSLAILAVTFTVRVAAIPLLLPLAVRSRDRQRVVRRIRPQIKALHKEFKKDPDRLSLELDKLHRDNGIKVADWAGAGAALFQVAILIAFFQAVLKVSEGSSPDSGGLLLGVVASCFSVLSTKVSGQSEGAAWTLWMAGLLPVAIAAWLGAGVGLYLTAFYAASAVQAAIMRERKAAQVSV